MGQSWFAVWDDGMIGFMWWDECDDRIRSDVAFTDICFMSAYRIHDIIGI
jgi:hypothetical protein